MALTGMNLLFCFCFLVRGIKRSAVDVNTSFIIFLYIFTVKRVFKIHNPQRNPIERHFEISPYRISIHVKFQRGVKQNKHINNLLVEKT